MIPQRDSLEALYSIGVTYRSAPAQLRDRLEVNEERDCRSLDEANWGEALLLSICDRAEVIGLGGEQKPRAILEAWARLRGLAADERDPTC
ncbi:MAG: hypothetical protein GDA41_09865 [Rhodospirillales bacterium]|nr:hypothetical protein [Rhodospirillales bacterium]